MIKYILEKLKASGINQDTVHTDIFSIIKKSQKEISITNNEVLESINLLMMKYFLDLMSTDQKKIYIECDFNIEINEKFANIKIVRETLPQLQKLINKIMEQKLSISKLFTFVEMVYKKLIQK